MSCLTTDVFNTVALKTFKCLHNFSLNSVIAIRDKGGEHLWVTLITKKMQIG